MPVHWQNWSGRVRCSPAAIERPDSIEAIQSVVRRAAAGGGRVRIVGSGHSFTDLVKTDETLLSLDNWQGVEKIAPDATHATVRAGTKLWRLGDELLARGLAMENLGDINRQSIAGAMGTGTHGTGAAFRNIPAQVEGITLVTASGEVIECSETENRDVFKAAQVSLGALGVVARVRLGVVPAFRLNYVRKRSTLDETEARLAEYRDQTRHFEFFLVPHTGAVQLKFLNTTDAPANPHPVRMFFKDVILENAFFGLVNRVSRTFPKACPAICRLIGRMLSESESVDWGHRVLATPRLVKFNEMEYSLPAENGMAALREIKRFIERERIEVCFPIEFRYVRADDAWLSPMHGHDTVCISLHMYRGMDYDRYFNGAETIFRAHGGRPHWGKLHNLKAADLAPLYPMWEPFQEVRRRLDPGGVFLNPYLRGLFGEA